MANETTYALISSQLPSIYEATMMYASETFVLPSIVTVYQDATGLSPRVFTEYSEGTAAIIAETADLSTQVFSRSVSATLTPVEVGASFFVTDSRAESDIVDVLADLSQHIGYTVFSKVESDLASLFNGFTAGTIGAASTALTWSHIFQARAVLAANRVPSPYNLVLSEYQWLDLASAANVAALSAPAPLRIRDDIQDAYHVATIGGDINVYTTPSIAAGTDVYGAMFSRRAIALDVRRRLRIEPERDASRRGTEVNATMVYAYGIVRPTWGVSIRSDGSAPA
ncbi:MAG: hypothetical protein KatS3mg087_1792 [Patescibacteria group bacterium]|nr:MAG: hypothetical protein KatS3mg087_1792 [Patescibacteria group bacterium]